MICMYNAVGLEIMIHIHSKLSTQAVKTLIESFKVFQLQIFNIN